LTPIADPRCWWDGEGATVLSIAYSFHKGCDGTSVGWVQFAIVKERVTYRLFFTNVPTLKMYCVCFDDFSNRTHQGNLITGVAIRPSGINKILISEPENQGDNQPPYCHSNYQNTNNVQP
jgi:hypothetical protein